MKIAALMDVQPDGAGYVAKDGYNLVASSDEWMSPVFTEVGPDGAVYICNNGGSFEWIDRGVINNLVTIGVDRDPAIPDTPALGELVTREEDKALVPLLAGPAAHGRAWVAFGDVPRDRLAALREAYAKTLADPGVRERIVRMAAPYARFPESIRRDVDVLVITRTWHFEQGDRVMTE